MMPNVIIPLLWATTNYCKLCLPSVDAALLSTISGDVVKKEMYGTCMYVYHFGVASSVVVVTDGQWVADGSIQGLK